MDPTIERCDPNGSFLELKPACKCVESGEDFESYNEFYESSDSIEDQLQLRSQNTKDFLCDPKTCVKPLTYEIETTKTSTTTTITTRTTTATSKYTIRTAAVVTTSSLDHFGRANQPKIIQRLPRIARNYRSYESRGARECAEISVELRNDRNNINGIYQVQGKGNDLFFFKYM